MDEEVLNPNPYKNPLVYIFATIVVIVLCSLSYLFGLQKGETITQFTSKTMTTSSVIPTSQNDSQENIPITLPVTQLYTSYGIDQITPYKYPETITIKAPKKFADQIGAYGVGERIIIGPKNWTGDGSIGADGNGYAIIYPDKPGEWNGDFGPHIRIDFRYNTEAIYTASYFFPWVRDHWRELSMPDKIAPTPPPQEKLQVTNISSRLARYTYYSANANLPTSGVIYSTIQDKPQNGIVQEMEISLPDTQSDLKTALLDIFVKQNNFDTK